ncbi:carbohydrate binding domain-containing protein [Anaerobaca lacustris]|uniref:Carbohydrate binding domain-containing protein n=1 Tax=Anaerobaca lacustris TaxID=3044600 RepID=A0AAW6TXQ4_9BACT|nr:carbohydrate binding domain-containing protein [Sedimentisphaerales bacterium M17dextr]
MKCEHVLLILMFLSTAAIVVNAQGIVNLFDNPGFEEGTGTDVQEIPGWRLYSQENATGLLSIDTEEAIEGKQCVRIEVTGVPAGGAWNFRFDHTRRFSVEQGETYTISFWLKGDPGPITLSPSRAEQNAAGQWGNLAQAVINPTPDWQEYHLTFVSPEDRLVMWQLLISNPGQTYWVDHARCYVGEYVPDQIGPKLRADSPFPFNGATDVPRDAALGWSPGEFAATHDVYLGAVFEDINDAARTDPRGVLLSQGQTVTTYDPPGLLDFGTTYYWRIDQVNAPPDSTIFKGNIWGFTTELFAYPVVNVLAASNGISEATAGPQNTVDGSGLNADDQHSIAATDMWLANPPDNDVLSIEFEFDRVYKLHEMLVWNYNVQFEPVLGFGLKDVTIECSVNGEDWAVLGDVEFARATARSNYEANTAVNFGGVAAQFIRLTVNSGWGPMGQFGLSEVRFLYIPALAREPQPADGAMDVDPETALSWRAGRDATAHDVYLGSDAEGLSLVDAIVGSSFAPDELTFGTTYYWRVDAVSDEVWTGDVWSFSTQEYAMIDGFEAYTDDIDAGEAIFDTWIDGWVNNTGSTVGYFDAPFAERTIVHNGRQSMPLLYDNTSSPFYSEAERTFASPRNWTVNGADTLRLFVAGRAPAFVEMADGTILMNAIGNDIWDNADQFRYVYKNLSGNGSITARVDMLDVSPDMWVKGGVMIRQNADPGAVNVFMAMTGSGGGGSTFQQRMTAGGASVSQHTYTDGPFTAPYWVRVTREDNTLRGYTSPDGENWTQRGDTIALAMTDPVLIGLALTSHNVNQATSAQFSNVAFTGNVTGAWQVAEVSVAQPAGNTVAPLYVALEDATGKSAVVMHPDANIVGRSGWNEWQIPLSEFTGVNLSRVDTMTIGVGSRTSPTAGGAGTIYVDDIAFGKPAMTQ